MNQPMNERNDTPMDEDRNEPSATQRAVTDTTLLQRITDLVDEENRLRGDTERPEQHADRIRDLEEQLDQLWDLLRQRRARREFGADPDGAQMRDRDTVERYLN